MNMIKVYVMQTCPDCAGVKELAKRDSRFEVIDIGAQPRNLKEFLALRDSSPAFNKVKERGTIGIPCFLLEDGRIFFSLSKLPLEELGITLSSDGIEPAADNTADGASCSIDGSGC